MNPIDPLQCTFNLTIKDRTKLEEDVSAFLLAGGKIEEIPFGESRASNSTDFNNSRGRGRIIQESILSIEGKPKESILSKTTPTTPKKKPTIDSKSIAQKIAEMRETPGKDLLTEADRRNIIQAKRKEAELKGDKHFEAPCKQHNLTQYVISGNASRCVACLKEYALKKNPNNHSSKTSISESTMDEAERRELVTAARMKAESLNKKQFTAPCLHHGNTTFVIYGNVARCSQCSKKYQELRKDRVRKKCRTSDSNPTVGATPEATGLPSVETPEVIQKTKLKSKTHKKLNPKDLERREKVRIARKEAEQLNENQFMAPCAYHGLTLFSIIGNASRCLQCRKNNSNARTQKLQAETLERQKLRIECEAMERKNKNINRKSVNASTSAIVNGLKTHNPRGKAYSKEQLRRLDISQKYLKAIDENQLTFTAVCKKHGSTTYKVLDSHPRCIQCIEDNKLKKRKIDSKEAQEAEQRRLDNLALAENAIKLGSRKFVGTCKYHDQAPHLVILRSGIKPDIRCLECENFTRFSADFRRNIKNVA